MPIAVETPSANPAAFAAMRAALGFADPYLGPVATSNLVPDNLNAGSQQQMGVTCHYARDSISSIRLIYPAWRWDVSSYTELANGANVTLEASIEYPIGTYTRMTFAGANQGTAVAGGMLTSDLVVLGFTIPNGALFRVRTWYSCSAGIIYAAGVHFGNLLSAGTTTPNYVMGGGNPASQGAAGYGPIAILGYTWKGTVAICGDSIAAGQGDAADNALNRGIIARSVGASLAYINLGCGGDRFQSAATNYTNRGALVAYCSHVISQYGANDVISFNRPPANVLADMQTFFGLSYFAGKPLFQTTYSPKVTGTYTSEAGQTVDADNADRMSVNASIRGGVAGIRGVLDTALVLESTVTPGKFQSPDSSALTGDGIHPNQRGALKMQSSGVISPGLFVR